MFSLKFWGVACTLGASTLLGCSHSADLPSHNSSPQQAHVTLQSHHWQLQHAQTPQGLADKQWQLPANMGAPARTVGLHFSQEQMLSVDRLCNMISGSYRIQGAQLEVVRLVSTMMACPDPSLMELEQKVAQQLTQVRHWKITPEATPLLELQFEGGTTWVLKGTPTPETLFGSSERVFLEVAPHTIACSPPSMAATQCLQTREVQYNQQGIRENAGPWNTYHGVIEGYTHQPGVRNVLRIKRFPRAVTPADDALYIDVLDMTVESEIVP